MEGFPHLNQIFSIGLRTGEFAGRCIGAMLLLSKKRRVLRNCGLGRCPVGRSIVTVSASFPRVRLHCLKAHYLWFELSSVASLSRLRCSKSGFPSAVRYVESRIAHERYSIVVAIKYSTSTNLELTLVSVYRVGL